MYPSLLKSPVTTEFAIAPAGIAPRSWMPGRTLGKVPGGAERGVLVARIRDRSWLDRAEARPSKYLPGVGLLASAGSLGCFDCKRRSIAALASAAASG